MTTSGTWPEPEAVLSRMEQIRLDRLRSHPDLWLDDETPAYRFRNEVPVRIVITPPLDGCDQRESRTYPGGEIDRTAPQRSYPAPGPQLNIYPRVQRSAFRQLLRALRGR